MSFIIGMVGLPAVGKSMIAQKIEKKFGFSHINKDRMRDFLIKNIAYYNDAVYSYSNPLISSVNSIVRPSSDLLVKELLEKGQNIIIDGYGKVKANRDHYKKLTSAYNPKIIIVYVKEKEEVILERLKQRDDNKNYRWVESYLNRWKPKFSEPSKKECDYLIEVWSKEYHDAIEKIGEILEDK